MKAWKVKRRMDKKRQKLKDNFEHNYLPGRVYSRLLETNFKWRKQSQWGSQVFDFWCHQKGIGIFVSRGRGIYSKSKKSMDKRKVVVFYIDDEKGLSDALEKICVMPDWVDRQVN